MSDWKSYKEIIPPLHGKIVLARNKYTKQLHLLAVYSNGWIGRDNLILEKPEEHEYLEIPK